VTVRRGGVAAAAALTAAALAGCVTMPAGGGVSVTSIGGSSVQAGQGLQVVPAPPADGWQPTQVVAGFLAASGASLTGSSTTGSGVSSSSFAVARLYLTGKFRQAWHPGSSATVIDAVPSISELPRAHTNIQPPATPAQVDVASQHVETLQQSGNIVVSPKSHVYQFDLVQEAGRWRIDGINANGKPAPNLLLLLRPDFDRDYQSRNLYFFPATGLATTLIPDPVFILQQQGTEGSVAALVAGLSQPGGWLQGAVTTAFRQGTSIHVQVSNVTAIVRLGGAALRATPAQLQEMAAQLVWTLTGPPGSPAGTGIDSVQLQVGHRAPMDLPGGSFPGYMSAWTPSVNLDDLYFQPTGPGALPQIAAMSLPGSTAAVPLPLPRGRGSGPFSVVAGPAPGSRSGILAACRGRTVFLMPARRAATASIVRLPTACTSLAWDDRGDLWATAGNNAWVLPLVTATAGRIRHSALIEALAESGRLRALSVAPDGVRVAMIEQTGNGPQILVAAISRYGKQFYLGGPSQQTVRVGSDIADPVALAWHYGDPNNLLVVGHRGSGAQQLFRVPLNGGDSVVLPNPLPKGIVSLQAMGQEVIVGTGSVPGTGPAGWIWASPSPQSGNWRKVAEGGTPVVSG
jgi:hypothetical protein